MQDLLLFAAVAAVFAAGWFFMGPLDRFLENSCHKEEGQGHRRIFRFQVVRGRKLNGKTNAGSGADSECHSE